MADPCTVVKLNVTDLDQAVKDPALAALLAEGWAVVASVVVETREGRPLLHVILSPPRPVAGLPGPGVWGIGLAVMLGALLYSMGALLYFMAVG